MLVATLATCHNRKERTLAALDDLHCQVLPENVTLRHFLVDDGSTDGTATAVAERYPDVHVIVGDGTLFWAGGMRLGWENLVCRERIDYLFVFNDDVRLAPDALSRLLASASSRGWQPTDRPFVVAGRFVDEITGLTTYGGWIRQSRWDPLKLRMSDGGERDIEVDTINMNGALISIAAIKRIGFLSDYCRHTGADTDFGLRLKRQTDGRVVLLGGSIGTCSRNLAVGTSRERGVGAIELIRRKHSIKEGSFSQQLRMYRANAGSLWLLHFGVYYVTTILRLAVRGVLRV